MPQSSSSLMLRSPVDMQHLYCRAGQEGPWHPLKLAKQFHDFLQKWRAERRGVSVMQMPHMAAFAGLGSYSQVSCAWL